jgi:hypothetical protein
VRKTVILVSTSSVDFLADDARPQRDCRQPRANVCGHAARELNVYQFDPRGLEVGRKISEEFGILSDNTGGRAFMNTNTPWEGVPQSIPGEQLVLISSDFVQRT